MTPRKWIYLIIACIVAFVIGLLLFRPRPKPQPPPTPADGPTPTGIEAAASPTRPPTPITIMTLELTPPPPPAPVPTPTYTIPQVGDSQFQRMLARQAGYQTYRFTTISHFSGGNTTAAPVGGGLIAARVEGEYDHGNKHQTLYQDGEVMLESIMVGDVAYNRMPMRDEAWVGSQLSPDEAMYLRVDPFILLLGDGSQLKPLGPDQLPDVPVSTVKYEVAVSPEIAATFAARVMGAVSADPSSPGMQALTEIFATQQTMFAWVGDDDNLYRVDALLHLQRPVADSSDPGPDEMTIELSTTYRDFDDPTIRVEPPEGVSGP
jgi:hypothetical protein